MHIIHNLATLLLSFPFVVLTVTACPSEISTESPDKPAGKSEYRISSARTELILTQKGEGSGYCLTINDSGQKYAAYEGAPVRLEVFSRNVSGSSIYKSDYQNVDELDGVLRCTAGVTTEGGSEFTVKDEWQFDASGTVILTRDVAVESVGSEYAFNSFFMLESGSAEKVSGYEYFLPSLLYRNGDNLNSGFIGSSLSDTWILAREDRMALPIAMMRNTASGRSISIADINNDYQSTSDDYGATLLCDSRYRFSSLGFNTASGKPVLVLCHPGSEGERTYADGRSSEKSRWARRSHPIKTSVRHGYTLHIRFAENDTFADALKCHWNGTFDTYDPQVLQIESRDVRDMQIELLDRYWMEDNGAPGFPFSVHLPSGQVNEISYDMGFVGMQVSCAYYLYREGLRSGNASLISKGESILDFWAENSAIDCGMPRVWWDISPWNSFRNSNDLRNMQGGLEAMILAWGAAEKAAGGSKPEWLRFCTGAADWMLSVQHSDGSLDMAYDSNGVSINHGLLLTSAPIRFLTYMYVATGEEKYRDAALKAGEFCYEQIHSPYRYVGCVIDNPYVMDRESGQKALEAFLCLYDLTGSDKWLNAAVQAAYYTVTYMYAWDVHRPAGNTNMAWSDDRSTVGITIISTGHSGADAGMSYNSFEYFRLYLLTGDEHLLKFARLIANNTKQTMDYDGKLSYAMRGLQTEALRVVTQWGNNVNLWLPWLTAAALDPLYKFEDAFGSMEIPEILDRGEEELRQANIRFGRTQGISTER